MSQNLTPEALHELSATFETRSPGEIISWAVETFADDIVYACSFQDLVLLDLVVAAKPDIEIIFLDTEAHFTETWDYVNEATSRYDLNLTITKPGPDAEQIPCGAEGCCQVRKVGPLKRAVAGKKAWFTAVKRVDAPTRATTPVIAWDDSFGLVKVNPLATWTDEDVAFYEAEHGLPQHPLLSKGYLSIGCAPTTKPVEPGADARSGRWAGMDKTECGLHE